MGHQVSEEFLCVLTPPPTRPKTEGSGEEKVPEVGHAVTDIPQQRGLHVSCCYTKVKELFTSSLVFRERVVSGILGKEF